MKMANITPNENGTIIKDLFCNIRLFGEHARIIMSALNIPLAITAFLGNVLIIAALQKPSSIHPPSKLLLGSLAFTDLCVGLISQPLRVIYLMSPEHLKRCYYIKIIFNSVGFVFCGLSLFTLTAISVDRLLALMLWLRYKHVVTLRRVWLLIVTFWLSIIAIAITIIYNFSVSDFFIWTITLLCLIISTFCYTKIYLALRQHQAQLHDHVYQGQPNGGRIPLNIARYKKTVSSALWVQITLVVCCLPFGIIVAVYAITGLNTPSIDLTWEASILVLMFNSSVNPFIY
ncbi:hypothetical protein ACROYT_G033848 [Oculina patagonica]